jgi:hypothetical protein
MANVEYESIDQLSVPGLSVQVDAPDEIRERFDFAASAGLTSVVSPGDPKLVATVADAAERYDGMDESARRSLVERLRHEDSPVPEQLHH